MNKFLDKLIQPKVFKFLQNLWFVLACVFCVLLVGCLLANQIVSVGYAIGGLGVSALMYFMNGRLLSRAAALEASRRVTPKLVRDFRSSTDTSI